MYRSSKLALLVCCLLLIAASEYYPKWEQQGTEATITPQKEWDLWKMPQFNLKFYEEGNSNPLKLAHKNSY